MLLTLHTRWKAWMVRVEQWISPQGLAPLSPVEAMLPRDVRRVIDCA